MLLSLDTATQMAGLALYDERAARVLSEETWYSSDNHSVELMPRLVRLMEQCRVSAADLDGVVVSLGPGSFTGLRTGIGVAKGLALARRLPLVGIPTLEVTARPHTTQPLPIWAILRAGRGRICVAHYVRRRGRWLLQADNQEGGEPRPYLTTLTQLCASVEPQALLCGEIDAHDIDLIREHLGPDVTIASPAASLRRAAYLAELGWERLARGDSDDPATLTPIYLQQPQIAA